MKTIAPAELQALLAAQPNLTVLDVRTPVEYAEIHVPQARNAPLDTLAPRELLEAGNLPESQPIYILCRTGARASKAAEKFEKEGFGNAVIVEGGTVAWNEAGLPVHRGSTKVISLERQVRIAAGSLTFIGAALAWFAHPYFIAVPAFIGAGLAVAGVTDFCGMGLLLAKAPWNRG